MKGIQN